MRAFRAPTQEQAGTLIAVAATLFGGWVRLLAPSMAGFPVNDGGLFYNVLVQMRDNGLRLPGIVHYNGLDIPFAYPPLGFDVGAVLVALFHIDPLKLLQWLPAIVLVATLPAFYLLAKKMLGTSFRAGIATLMFAFTPRAIAWQIMGGGLTRSFGQLFMILALAFIYETFSDYSRRRLLLAILFSALVVLSHPEAALQTVGFAVVLWLFKGRSKQGILHALEIGAGTLVLTSLWWLPAIVWFGTGSLMAAAGTGQHGLYALLEPFAINLANEPLLTLVGALGIIGFAFELSKRRALLAVLFFAPFLFDPRSAPTAAMLPLALLAGVALCEVVLPALAGALAGAADNVMHHSGAVVFLVFLGLYMLGSTAVVASRVAGTALTVDMRSDMAWIRENTPPSSRFIVLTGESEQQLFCDAPLEWFPALAERQSVTTVQGREWPRDNGYNEAAGDSMAAAICVNGENPLACLQALPVWQQASFDYIYVARRAPELDDCQAVGVSARPQQLIEALKASPGYTLVHDGGAGVVFKEP